MTHLYVILVGGTVIRGRSAPDATALAWAGDTVLAIGTDEEMRAMSRGDSTVVELDGATVVPLQDGGSVWPTNGRLEVGRPASFAIVAGDPRAPGGAAAVAVRAVVRSGVLISGALPGLAGPAPSHGSPRSAT